MLSDCKNDVKQMDIYHIGFTNHGMTEGLNLCFDSVTTNMEFSKHSRNKNLKNCLHKKKF